MRMLEEVFVTEVRSWFREPDLRHRFNVQMATNYIYVVYRLKLCTLSWQVPNRLGARALVLPAATDNVDSVSYTGRSSLFPHARPSEEKYNSFAGLQCLAKDSWRILQNLKIRRA